MFLENCQYCTAGLCNACSKGRVLSLLKGKGHKITARAADHFVEGALYYKLIGISV
jgi:hypothetical protein